MSTLRLPTRKAPPAPPKQPSPLPLTKALVPERASEKGVTQERPKAERKHNRRFADRLRREKHLQMGVAELRRRWPELFTLPVPLALGVGQQISAAWPEMSWTELVDLLKFWTRRTAYLQAVAAGVQRCNLDGIQTGVPTEEQQAVARNMLRRRGKWPVKAQDAGPAQCLHPGGHP